MNAHIDRLDTLSLVERLGVVRSLTRKARVLFPPAFAIPQDYRVLWLALQDAGIPAPFTPLSDPGYKALVLVERGVELVLEDTRTFDVMLKYEHLLDGPYQQIFNSPYGVLYGKVRGSIVQKPTNFFRVNGNMDSAQIPILTAHSFPLPDPDSASMNAFNQRTSSPRWPYTVVQGGEINVPFPQINYHLEGVLTVADPWKLLNRLLRAVNRDEWLGQRALTWLCTEIQFEALDPFAEKPLYKFTFDFQNDVDGWNPVVVFKDQRTGLPPYKVVKASLLDDNGVLNQVRNRYLPEQSSVDANGVVTVSPNRQPAGYWTVPFCKQVDFNQEFGAVFEGPGPF